MQRLISSMRFLAKAAALMVFLMAGWAFINVTNLFKAQKPQTNSGGEGEKFYDSHLLEAPSALADTSGGCPHVAYFDGKEFKIENDFLLGKPKSFFTDYSLLKLLYEAGRIGPDMVKFTNAPQKKDGFLTLQLQEIEQEETFVDWLKFIRVLHPKTSEVVVNADFTKYHVFDKNELEKKLALPVSAVLNDKKNISERFLHKKWLWQDPAKDEEILYQKGDRAEFIFRGLNPNENTLLLIKTQFRDWMMGRAPDIKQAISEISFGSFLRSPATVKAFMLAAGTLYLSSGKQGLGSFFAMLPFIVGSAGGGEGGGGGGAGSDSASVGSCESATKSIIFSYISESGKKRHIIVHEPRDWRYGIEAIEIPQSAIRSDGSLVLQADFTKRHKFAFAGVFQGASGVKYREEEVTLREARHSRQGEIKEKLAKKGEYAHLIPGDTVDLVYETPTLQADGNEKETYLMQSSGFYTSLRPDYEKIAGNWHEKLSLEAKAHYREIALLNRRPL